MVEFKDAKGEFLEIGDFVAFKEKYYNGFNFGRIIKFTPKMVKIEQTGAFGATIKDPVHLLKIEGPFIEGFMASKGMV